MLNVFAMILAGGQGDRLSVLSDQRAKPAVVFGGQYRIVDFVLSNCMNSGLQKVAVLTHSTPALARGPHRQRPRHGALVASRRTPIQTLQPYLGRADMDWYQGTADAVYQNLYVIEDASANEVLILAGDHIYLTSYRNMLKNYHQAQGADCTVAVYSVPREETYRYGVLDLDATGRVVDFQEKPAQPRAPWASMGIYIFNKDVLIRELEIDAELENSSHDFGRDIIPRIFQTHRVFGYQYQGYWRDVGTVESYWNAHMDLLAANPP